MNRMKGGKITGVIAENDASYSFCSFMNYVERIINTDPMLPNVIDEYNINLYNDIMKINNTRNTGVCVSSIVKRSYRYSEYGTVFTFNGNEYTAVIDKLERKFELKRR